MVNVARNLPLETVYAVTAFTTLLVGLVALSAGIRSEVVTPIVLVGAVIVGMISLYWLLGGEEGPGGD